MYLSLPLFVCLFEFYFLFLPTNGIQKSVFKILEEKEITSTQNEQEKMTKYSLNFSAYRELGRNTINIPVCVDAKYPRLYYNVPVDC